MKFLYRLEERPCFSKDFFILKARRSYENLDEKCDNFIEMDKFCHSVGL